MKYQSSVLSVVVVVILLILSGCSSYRYEIVNNGLDALRVRTGFKKTMVLGQNSTLSLRTTSSVEIGNAAISVGQRVKITNTGSDVIQIKYLDAEGSEQTLLLGENGIGYLSKATPFQIDDFNVRIY